MAPAARNSNLGLARLGAFRRGPIRVLQVDDSDPNMGPAGLPGRLYGREKDGRSSRRARPSHSLKLALNARESWRVQQPPREAARAAAPAAAAAAGLAAARPPAVLQGRTWAPYAGVDLLEMAALASGMMARRDPLQEQPTIPASAAARDFATWGLAEGCAVTWLKSKKAGVTWAGHLMREDMPSVRLVTYRRTFRDRSW